MSGAHGTAADRLLRILALLPIAARGEAVTVDDLAEHVGATRDDVIGDLMLVGDRELYHAPGGADDIQVTIEPDSVRVWTTRFDRPVRLTLREAAALELGLRVIAAERGWTGEPPDLAGRLARELAWPEHGTAAGATVRPEDLTGAITVQPDRLGADEIRSALASAAREHRRCRIEYLKPSADPESRLIDPYLITYSAGQCYAIGYSPERGGVRTFRLDRILGVEPLAERFEIPSDFDPLNHVSGGMVFSAEHSAEVEVRLRGEAARRAGCPDGDVVRYRVADPGWMVRRVLGQGPDAEVIAPAEARANVRDAAIRLCSSLEPEPPAATASA